MRYFLKISYLGTHYHGWQRQDNAISIQSAIEEALAQVLRQSITLFGSSRTDAGVHAKEQYAHVDLEHPVDVHQLRYQINALLPPSIAITDIRGVQETAHARFDALSRVYTYRIVQEKSPFLEEISYWLRNKPPISPMNQGASFLCGIHNLENFSKKNKGAIITHQCHVITAFWEEQPGQILFTIQANRFLRGMVRIIVSTLLQVGYGKLSLPNLIGMIRDKNDHRVQSLVPPCGLTLEKVYYPNKIFFPVDNPILF